MKDKERYSPSVRRRSPGNFWITCSGLLVALLGSAALFRDMKPHYLQAKETGRTETASYQTADGDRGYSLVAATIAGNADLPPCPTPAQKTTGVLIESDKPGENTGRKARIEEVVRQNNLPGKWCISAKTNNVTWNLDGVSVNEAVRVFDLFKAANLVSYARPTNSASGGRVVWRPAEASGASQNVAAEMPGANNPPNGSSITEDMSGQSPLNAAPYGSARGFAGTPGANGGESSQPCDCTQAFRNRPTPGRTAMAPGDRRPAGF